MHMGAQRIQYSSSAGASCTTYVGQLPVLELPSSLSALEADLRAQRCPERVLKQTSTHSLPGLSRGPQ